MYGATASSILICIKEYHMMKKVVFGLCVSMGVAAYAMDCADEKMATYGVMASAPIVDGMPVYMAYPTQASYADVAAQYTQLVETLSSLINSGDTNLNYFKARLLAEQKGIIRVAVPEAYADIHQKMVDLMSRAGGILLQALALAGKSSQESDAQKIVEHLSVLVKTFGSAFKSC